MVLFEFTVGMKLSLLNPTLAIDLQYLGVQLPFPSPVNSFSSTGKQRRLN